MIHDAELDTRTNDGWSAFLKALKSAGTQHQAFMYPGVNHGFHNDSTPRYDEAAAKLAWQRTLHRGRHEFVQMKVVLAQFAPIVTSSDFFNTTGWTDLASRLDSNSHCMAYDFWIESVYD